MERLDEAIKILRKIAKANDGKRKKFCLNMLEYLEKQWLNGNVPREVWNMYLHKGVTTNNHAEGYSYKMGAKNKICKHPNPYTLADVIRSELTECCDTATSKKKKLNPNAQKLIKRRKDLMIDLRRRNVDLETYIISIGAITMKYDPRVKKDNDPDPFSDGEKEVESDKENSELEEEINLSIYESRTNQQEACPPSRTSPGLPASLPTSLPTCQPTPHPGKYKKGKKQKQKPAPNTRESFIHVNSRIDGENSIPSLVGDDLRQYTQQQTVQEEEDSIPFVSIISSAAMASAGLTVLSRFSSSPSARRTPRRRTSALSAATPRQTSQSRLNATPPQKDVYILAARRLEILGFKFSSSQSRTRGDGNCMLYALGD